MTSHRVQPPIRIEPRRSRRLAAFVLVTHLVAALCTCLLPWPWPLVLIPLAAGLIYQMRVHVLRRAPWSIRTLHWQADGSWQIELVDGSVLDARLLPSTFVGLRLLVLNLAVGRWRRFSLPLPGDSLDPEDLRRLRQRLRIEGAGRSGDNPPA